MGQSKEKAVEHNKKEKHEQQVTRVYNSTQDDGEHHETSEKKKQKKKSKKEKDAKILDFPLLHHNNSIQDEGENHGGGQKRKKKKKKKRDQGEHEARLLDHGKVSMHYSEEDDMLFNFSVEPKVVVDNLASHGSKREQVMHHLNGSSLQDDKTQNEGLNQQKHSKKNRETFDEKIPVEQNAEEVVKESSNWTESSKYVSRPTVSIAVAGSIVDNAQSIELATMLAGQIARAAAIFRIDEIVVFDDYDGASTASKQAKMQDDDGQETGGIFLVRILEYLEVPQYLRRALIPMHRSLSSVGKLPPLDAPHHLRRYEWQPFREGVVLDKRPSSGSGSYVDVGLDKEVLIDQSLKPGTRVTVAMGQTKTDGDMLQVVDHEAARQAGIYWGYRVRYASCLSAVFEECPFEGKYDYCIGTSEHGKKVRPMELLIPKCRHLLIAFGGLSGLEESLELDRRLKVHNVTSLFDQYLNTCPNQGSRTIRTEEAILISLQCLQEAVQQAICPT